MDATEIKQAGKEWRNSRHGVLNYHPGYEVLEVLEVLPVVWDKGTHPSIKIEIKNLDFVFRGEGEVHLAPAVGGRCVQWCTDCVVAVNGAQKPYAPAGGCNWNVKVPLNTKITSVHYVDRAHATRVPHDPVPPVQHIIFFRCSPLKPDSEVLSSFSPTIPRATFAPSGDTDVLSIDEFLKSVDPVSLQLIKIPVRPSSHEHAQCLDLGVIVSSFSQASTSGLACFVCQEKYDLQDLIIDNTFWNWMKAMKQAGLMKQAGRGYSIKTDLYRKFDVTADASLLLQSGGEDLKKKEIVEEILDDSDAESEPLEVAKKQKVELTAYNAPRSDRATMSSSSRKDRVLRVGKVIATLAPNPAGQSKPNLFWLGMVSSITPPDPSGVALLKLCELTATPHPTHPYFTATTTEWKEHSSSTAPVEGRWVAIGKSKGFELHEGETARLKQIPLDLS
eukprot:TRINITY_DN6112_c1_g5_i1.p1 TRINITY_DN6112_c1_g5~~TRINITY_DN6112_c1_g5_i1.p1  ORF type:complete len:468 (+),score=72.24 TRINITY_DN6112_c1_g5_i1:66-1406(+)